jgi:alkylation response protein AidB-like acyl-CoA dehydrogenase
VTAVSQLLGDEELQLRSAAADMLRGESPVSAFRRLRDDNCQPRYDASLWAKFADMGWTGMLVPEAHGGLAFGHRGVGLLCEEIGRNLVATPFVSTCVHAVSLLAHASAELQAQLLPAIATAATTVAVAPGADSRFAPTATAVRAEAQGGNFLLQGSQPFVVDGGFAEHFIVLARSAGEVGDTAGLSLFHVPRAALPDGALRLLHMVDERDCAQLCLDDLRVPAGALIGRVGEAWPLLEEWLDVAAAHSAAELLGIADALFDLTLNYLKVREQFDAPIGSFQALQHRASIMFTRLELLRSVVLDAYAALDEQREDRSLACSHARVQAIDTSRLIAAEAVQLHGGMGVTDELDVGLYFKRSLTLRQFAGSRGYHRDRFARCAGY